MYIEMFLLQLLDDRTFSLREFSCGLIDHHPSPHAARPHPYGGAGSPPQPFPAPLLLTYLSPQARLLDPSGSLRVRWCCIERRHTVWEAILGVSCGRHCRFPTFVFLIWMEPQESQRKIYIIPRECPFLPDVNVSFRPSFYRRGPGDFAFMKFPRRTRRSFPDIFSSSRLRCGPLEDAEGPPHELLRLQFRPN